MTSFGACGDVLRKRRFLSRNCRQRRADERLGGDLEAPDREAFARPPTRTGDLRQWRQGRVTRRRRRATVLRRDVPTRKFKIAVAHPNENCVTSSPKTSVEFGVHPRPATDSILGGGGLVGPTPIPTRSRAWPSDDLRRLRRGRRGHRRVLVTYRELGDRPTQRARMKYVVATWATTVPQGDRGSPRTRTSRALELPPTSTPTTTWLAHSRRRDPPGRCTGFGRSGSRRAGRHPTALGAATHRATSPVTFFLTAQQDVVISGISDDARGTSKRS